VSQLTSVTVTDFRSIRGTITVPLDAPIVLVHGQNGAGKTSLLSAIELALTGNVPSLMRADSEYVSHLVHKSAERSRVAVEASGLSQSVLKAELEIGRHAVTGKPLLSGDIARFYSERCFLAQSTLSRLLELYEKAPSRDEDSPLTKFVKDLLGLDYLDALIDGLYEAGDVRRLRTSVPLYSETRDKIPALEKTIQEKESDLQANRAAQVALVDGVEARMQEVGLGNRIHTVRVSDNVVVSDQQLIGTSDQPEELELRRLSSTRVEIRAAREQWDALEAEVDQSNRENAERTSSKANAELEEWDRISGRALDALLNEAGKFSRALSSILVDGPRAALLSAISAVESERERCKSDLALADETERKVQSADQEIKRAKARVEALDQQIAEHAEDAGSLGKALADLLPHIHSDDCPVCGRDFSEVKSYSLQEFVSEKIGILSASAGRLQVLFRERTATASALAVGERDLAQLVAVQIAASAIDEMRTREAQLVELQQRLESARADAEVGEQLHSAASSAARAQTELQSRNLRADSIREVIARLSNEVLREPATGSQAIPEILDRLESVIAERMDVLFKQEAARRQTAADNKDLASLEARARDIRAAIEELKASRDRYQKRQDAADALIRDAKELSKRARNARTSIVQRVFDESLNTVWRDLFVRLAPDEPFVPRFALPEKSDGAVEAVLQTIYRSGGEGGNPKAMLSAGNLNTAALTLFLALHLTVQPTLPWLVIDDPVQSMDEVHIAQWAALMRTLAKVHGRQLIVAVHEKPLFDYLCLELGPAFQSDKLITIELTRSASGETLMNYRPVVWQPDKAIAA